MNPSPRPVSLAEKRLAKLWREAALAQIRGEYARAIARLTEAAEALAWAGLPEGLGALFVEEWQKAVRAEKAGASLPLAPAAWIHLGQELAALLESGGDWDAYLRARWALRAERLSPGRRALYAAAGMGGSVLGALVFFSLAQSVFGPTRGADLPFALGHRQALLFLVLAGRVAGSLFMMEYSLRWLREAVVGRTGKTRPQFLPRSAGLALAPSPQL